MPGNQDYHRRISERIQRVVANIEGRPFPQQPDHTPQEIRDFMAEIAATGADIGGGPYPTPDSIAFFGPEHEIAPQAQQQQPQAQPAQSGWADEEWFQNHQRMVWAFSQEALEDDGYASESSADTTDATASDSSDDETPPGEWTEPSGHIMSPEEEEEGEDEETATYVFSNEEVAQRQRRRNAAAQRRAEENRSELERIEMHEPGWTGRLVITNL